MKRAVDAVCELGEHDAQTGNLHEMEIGAAMRAAAEETAAVGGPPAPVKEAMNDDERAAWDASENARLDTWIPDLSRPLNEAEGASLNTFYTDEAAVRLVVPPFALLQLNTDVRRKVLAFMICTSQNHALRQRPESDATRHVPDTTRSLLRPLPKPSGTVEVFSSNGTVSSTVLRGAAPRSTAAAVSALFHHTATLRVVCRELRTDAVALYSAANSTATPRSWLANLYCRRDEPAAATAILSELRGRVLSGRQANMVRELFLRKNACSNFPPPEYGRTSRYGDFAQQTISQGHISSRVMVGTLSFARFGASGHITEVHEPSPLS